MSGAGDETGRSRRSRRREPSPRIGADDRALAEAVVADLERFGRSAARIVARGRDAFLDREDDLLRRAGRSVVIDVSAAVDRLPEAVRDAHPEIPWRAIRTTRNIVAHAYDDVNEEYMWEALRTGIPQLLEGLDEYRADARSYVRGGDVTGLDQRDPNAVLQDLQRRMRETLRDFEPPTGARAPSGRSIAVTLDRLPVPRLVQWAMTWALGAPDHGKDEKRAWLTTFQYKGIPCSLGLYKFGMRLFVGIDTDEADTLADEIVNRIDQAVRVAEGDILTDFAGTQLRAGNVTVQNQYGTFLGLYWHFRDRLPDDESPDEVDDAEPIDRVARRMNAVLTRQREHFYASVALVNAYFSLLEHLLVLLWPFVSYRPGVDDVESMIKSRWSDKFKRVFDIENNADAKRVYDRLRNVAEEYRNTYAHGGFDKRRGSLFVHFPGGAIPASLSESRRRIRASFFPIAEPDVDEILSVLDEADEWFRSGPAAFGMIFAESGIDVPFDSDSLSDLRRRMTTLDDFENHLRGLSRWLDNQTNMDW